MSKEKKAPTQGPAKASVSKLPKGGGTNRDTNRIITIYGGFKTRKTTSVSTLPMGRTKWLVSDPNCVPTLKALGRLPHPDDIYEVNGVPKLRELLETFLQVAEAEGKEALGIDYLVLDSATQLSDWHQAQVARDTGQRFLGDNKSENGWAQFNAEFGACLDLFAMLAAYCHIVIIVHAKAKFDLKKGEFSSFSLSPGMSERLGRMSNWVLLKSFTEVVDDEKLAEAKAKPDDPYYSHENDLVYEDIFYTKPQSGWVASVNSLKMNAEEPGRSLLALLEKDGIA